MSQFNPEDFRDSIDDMCDNALRRLFALQEGGLVAMEEYDSYVCDEITRNDVLDVIEFNTSIKTTIVDAIHPSVLEDEIPDYTLDILGGAVVALAARAAFLGRGSTVIVPGHEAARSHVYERLMFQESSVETGKKIRLYAQELGSLGLVDLALDRHAEDWHLHYHAIRRTALVRY